MKVAIVGYDVEGQASYRHFKRLGADITIFDESDQPRATPPIEVPVVSGPDALPTLAKSTYDKVMRTPGLNPEKLRNVANVSSGTREFFDLCPCPIIGVTGSKGKGTTASLITAILRASGRKVHLVGNIGIPALDVVDSISKTDVVVYELSSFQLWDMHASPEVAVVLGIEPDHLDVHNGIDDYVTAKSNIAAWQTANDTVVYNPHNHYSRSIADRSDGASLPYTKAPGASVEDGWFVMDGRKICETSVMKIPGGHNLDNACAAITAVWAFVTDENAIAEGLGSFEGLDHRLKYVTTIKDISYYDDSIATTPGSAIAAIKAFDKPKVLILGGSDKGADYDPLVQSIVAAGDGLRAIVTVGQTGPAIADAIAAAGAGEVIVRSSANSMADIVADATAAAQPGDVVILSPASASFDMFKSYHDRGQQFVDAVKSLR